MLEAYAEHVYELTGAVQGVGFRPALYRLATRDKLAGSVQNRAGAVRLTLSGPTRRIEAFLRELPGQLPPAARIDACTLLSARPLAGPQHPGRFRIVTSDATDPPRLTIPADLAMCPACRADIHNPADRRYSYAFTTCTDCGPRYTVLHGTPFDRAATSMSAFPLCPACQMEFNDPENRRFHAQTMACPGCGPQLRVRDAGGVPLDRSPLKCAREALARGSIVAMRGLGGFLLAADASQQAVLKRLRERKQRPHKPFAVMAADLETVKRVCHLPHAAARSLASPQAPIVILDVKPRARQSANLAFDLISPDTGTLGVMLPNTPMHELLFRPGDASEAPCFDFLIMTSGNRRSEPTCTSNEEALERLRGIADLFLLHDREIVLRNDDSLAVIQEGAPQLWRRARGYAPLPLPLPAPVHASVLAMGSEIKNTITLAYERQAVISPHVGDLETLEAVESLVAVTEALPAFLDRRPEVVAVDLHPDMHSTIRGRDIAARAGLDVVEVQHHHAHALACLAENGLEQGLALVFDGTGLGPDGQIWGAELLSASPGGYRRLATFAPVPLPGGDAAVRQPVRQLVARWSHARQTIPPAVLSHLGAGEADVETWTRQCRTGINAPMTHAAGRVFDSVSCALGFAPATVTYDGQAAIRLEAAARRHTAGNVVHLDFSTAEHDGMLVVDWTPTFAALLDRRSFIGREEAWAMGLHHAIARACGDMLAYGLSRFPSAHVALSGGVFMNKILTGLLVPMIESMGARAAVHRQTPPNDACVSLGQAVIAGCAREDDVHVSRRTDEDS